MSNLRELYRKSERSDNAKKAFQKQYQKTAYNLNRRIRRYEKLGKNKGIYSSEYYDNVLYELQNTGLELGRFPSFTQLSEYDIKNLLSTMDRLNKYYTLAQVKKRNQETLKNLGKYVDVKDLTEKEKGIFISLLQSDAFEDFANLASEEALTAIGLIAQGGDGAAENLLKNYDEYLQGSDEFQDIYEVFGEWVDFDGQSVSEWIDRGRI